MTPDTQTTINLAEPFYLFFVYFNKQRTPEAFCFSLARAEAYLHSLPQGYVNSQLLSGLQEPCYLSISKNIILIHNLDEIMLIRLDDWEVARIFYASIRHLPEWGQILENLSAFHIRTRSGIQQSRASCDIFSKVKEKLLHLKSPITKKEVQSFLVLYGYFKQSLTCLGVLLDQL